MHQKPTTTDLMNAIVDLHTAVANGFARVDKRFAQVDKGLDRLERGATSTAAELAGLQRWMAEKRS